MIVAVPYTMSTPYAELAERCVESGSRFGIKVRRCPYLARGSWEANCAAKAEIACRILEHEGGPLLLVDADATFERLSEKPEIPRVAAVRRMSHGQMCSGTVLFGPEGLELAAAWRAVCRANPGMWDQEALSLAVGGWEVDELPVELCCIFDHPEHEGADPVILHHQASREQRRPADAFAVPTFEQALCELPQPLAVVGNGPLRPLERVELEGYPTVLRFNNWAATGRTTAWIVNCWPDVFYVPIGLPLLTPYHPRESPQVVQWQARWDVPIAMPEVDWPTEARRLKRKPSTGLITLVSLRELGLPHRAFAFDGLTTGDHDHPPEREVLERLGYTVEANGAGNAKDAAERAQRMAPR